MFRPDELSPELVRIAEEFRAEQDTDIVVYSGEISTTFADHFVEEVMGSTDAKGVLLVLTTYGGSADGAYKIARSLQREYDSFRLAVRTTCKSAGTLIALGANELVLSPTAELGPLDVQLQRPDSLGERISGLTPLEAMTTLLRESFSTFEYYFLEVQERSLGSITATTAADIAVRMTTGLFRPLYSQLDPLRIGEYQRALSIAGEYGLRLANEGGNVSPGAIRRLLTAYPAHEFVIDFEEATTLFEVVSEPLPHEQLLFNALDVCDLLTPDGRRFTGSSREPYYGYLRQQETSDEREQAPQAEAPEAVFDDDEAGFGSDPSGSQPRSDAPIPHADRPDEPGAADASNRRPSEAQVQKGK